jgi:hypothetical protein
MATPIRPDTTISNAVPVRYLSSDFSITGCGGKARHYERPGVPVTLEREAMKMRQYPQRRKTGRHPVQSSCLPDLLSLIAMVISDW